MNWKTLLQYATRIPAAALLIACLVLGLAALEERVQVNEARRHDAATALAIVNAEAELDSTRNIADASEAVAGVFYDSLALVEKRVMQVAQKRDALDAALNRERRASYAMNLSLDSLRTFTAALWQPVSDTSGATRRASFAVRDAPYTLVAQVEIPAPPDSARMALVVALDTIPLRARITCVPYIAHGASTAAIVAESPPWAHVQFGQVEQAPEVCNPPRAAKHHIAFKPLAIGAGRAAMWGGATGWALFVGAVLTLN